MNDRQAPDPDSVREPILERQQTALKTAFLWAASDGDTDMLRELLTAGAKPEWCGPALLRASENGRFESTKFLLDAVDNMDTAKCAFRLAAAKEHHDTIKAIVDWIDKKQKTSVTNVPTPPSPPA